MGIVAGIVLQGYKEFNAICIGFQFIQGVGVMVNKLSIQTKDPRAALWRRAGNPSRPERAGRSCREGLISDYSLEESSFGGIENSAAGMKLIAATSIRVRQMR